MEANDKRLKNLKPFKKGDPRINRAGRKPGVKNWSTVVQQLLADEELLDKVVANKPSYWEYLPTKNAANAIAVAMMIKAMSGQKDAAEWLRKSGYGDKVQLDLDDGFFESGVINFNVISARQKEETKDE